MRTFIDATYYMCIPSKSIAVRKTDEERGGAVATNDINAWETNSDFVALFDPWKHPLVQR
jgi:hypothetical protein